jgi:hypothetical protein
MATTEYNTKNNPGAQAMRQANAYYERRPVRSVGVSAAVLAVATYPSASADSIFVAVVNQLLRNSGLMCRSNRLTVTFLAMTASCCCKASR